jgi:hypothetical protein
MEIGLLELAPAFEPGHDHYVVLRNGFGTLGSQVKRNASRSNFKLFGTAVR